MRVRKWSRELACPLILRNYGTSFPIIFPSAQLSIEKRELIIHERGGGGRGPECRSEVTERQARAPAKAAESNSSARSKNRLSRTPEAKCASKFANTWSPQSWQVGRNRIVGKWGGKCAECVRYELRVHNAREFAIKSAAVVRRCVISFAALTCIPSADRSGLGTFETNPDLAYYELVIDHEYLCFHRLIAHSWIILRCSRHIALWLRNREIDTDYYLFILLHDNLFFKLISAIFESVTRMLKRKVSQINLIGDLQCSL